MKRPAFQFYPADWRKDPALSACSLAARGLWIELMCIAHEAEQYGVLAIAGKAMTEAQLARMAGESPKTAGKLLAELEDAGVFSRNDVGAIYSRRMVNDELIRTVRAEAGRLGGNPDLLNKKVKQKEDGLLNQNIEQTCKQTPTPSSSSSSSTPSSLRSEGGARKSPPAEKFDALAYLLACGVDRQVARDWLTVRRGKRLAPTQTAFDDIAAEARKSGMSMAEAVERACKNGWGGFKAAWPDPSLQPHGRSPPANGKGGRLDDYISQQGYANGERTIEGTAEVVGDDRSAVGALREPLWPAVDGEVGGIAASQGES